MCGACVLPGAVWSVLHCRLLRSSVCHFGSGFCPSLAVFSINLNHANTLTSHVLCCWLNLCGKDADLEFLFGHERHKSTERKDSDFNPAASNLQNIFDRIPDLREV